MSDVSRETPVKKYQRCACGEPKRPGQGNCNKCNAKANREFRARQAAKREKARAHEREKIKAIAEKYRGEQP